MKRSLFWIAVLSLFSTAFPVFSAELIPNVEMIDQNGKKFHTHDFKGKYVLISWVFSTCPMPKMCPLTMQHNQTIQKSWKKVGDKSRPLQLLIITLDPEEDKPEVLKKYGERFQLDLNSSTLATGDAKVLSRFGSHFNVAGWPSAGTTVHNLKTILIGPDLVERKQYKDNEWQPEDVINDLKKL